MHFLRSASRISVARKSSGLRFDTALNLHPPMLASKGNPLES